MFAQDSKVDPSEENVLLGFEPDLRTGDLALHKIVIKCFSPDRHGTVLAKAHHDTRGRPLDVSAFDDFARRSDKEDD